MAICLKTTTPIWGLISVILLSLPELGFASLKAWEGGVEIGLSANAGSLPTKGPAYAPSVWIQYGSDREGYNAAIEYFRPYGSTSMEFKRPIRVSLWVQRYAVVSILHQSLRLSTGLGWGLETRRTRGALSQRGALGFCAEIGSEVWKPAGHELFAGIRYTASPWPGSGYVEDRLELRLRLYLFSLNGSASQ
jgi:hypothetical protein